MLHALSEKEFDAVLNEKRRKFDHFYNIGLSILTEITTDFLDKLDGNQVSILLFLWNRTFNFSRAGAQIYFFQFMKGVKSKDTEESICAPLSMSDKTFRKHLNALCDEDYIHIYSKLEAESGVENTPRIYEINIEKFAKTATGDGGNSMLPTPKRLKKPNGRNDHTPLEETSIHKSYINNVSTKVDIPPTALRQRRATSAGSKSPVAIAQEEGDSAIAVVERITRQHRETRATRAAAASASTGTIDQPKMQALLDEIRMQYTPNAIRMVPTQKAFGMFRKNLKANPPDDLRKFLTHICIYWSDIARSNAKAIQRAGTKRDPISPAPDFASLAYRYNYFLKIYSSGSIEAREDDKVQEISRLKAQLSRVQEDNGELRRRARQATPRPTAPPRPTRIARSTDDDDLPAWDDVDNEGERKHG